MKFMKSGDVFDHIIDIMAVIAGVIIVFMMLGITVQVVMRYFLKSPIFWMMEVTEYSLLFVPFLATAWLLKVDGHVKMDLLTSHLNPRSQALINAVTSVIGAIVFFIITWYSGQVTWELYELGFYINTLLKPPKYVIMVIIPIGSMLFSIQLLRKAYSYLRTWRLLAI